ncbi:SMI1/KNR4 family protein [Amycolatopsis japonica]
MERVERELDVRLPVQYKEFMMRHGGGAGRYGGLVGLHLGGQGLR